MVVASDLYEAEWTEHVNTYSCSDSAVFDVPRGRNDETDLVCRAIVGISRTSDSGYRAWYCKYYLYTSPSDSLNSMGITKCIQGGHGIAESNLTADVLNDIFHTSIARYSHNPNVSFTISYNMMDAYQRYSVAKSNEQKMGFSLHEYFHIWPL